MEHRFSGKLVLLTLASRSGIGRFASELARAACRIVPNSLLISPELTYEPSGIERVFLGGKKPKKSSALVQLLRSIGLQFSATIQTFRQVRRGDTLLMITLSPFVPLSIMPLVAARLRGAVVVLNLHDFYPHALLFPKGLRWLERWFYVLAYRCCDLVAPTNPNQISQLAGIARLPKKRIVPFKHGAFPVGGVRAPAPGTPNAVFIILGSLRQNKRILQSIEAIAELQAEGLPVELRIAGHPQHLERKYWQECRRALRNVTKYTLIERFVEEAEMPDILSGVDALLCPYEDFSSQSGISVMGLSNGIPLIATEFASVGHLAGTIDGQTSPVETPVSTASIKAAIRTFLATDRPQRLRQAAGLRDRFLEQKIWKRNMELIIERVMHLREN